MDEEGSSHQIYWQNQEYIWWSSDKYQTYGSLKSTFSITSGLHQGSALSPFLFTITIDKLPRAIQNQITWNIYYLLILVDETGTWKNVKLVLQRHESRGFQLSRSKTKYVKHKFSKKRIQDYSVMKLDSRRYQWTISSGSWVLLSERLGRLMVM